MEKEYDNKTCPEFVSGSKEAEATYIKGLKKLSGEERIKIASDLFEAVKEIATAGIIHQNPNISEEGLKAELNKRLGR